VKVQITLSARAAWWVPICILVFDIVTRIARAGVRVEVR
jgi:hypothetical protein